MKTWAEQFIAAPSKASLAIMLERATRELLLMEGAGPFTTVDIVERLWPPNSVRGEEAARRRQEVFALLAELARGPLSDVARQGAPKLNRFKRTIRPWEWGYVEKKCPHCGGTL